MACGLQFILRSSAPVRACVSVVCDVHACVLCMCVCCGGCAHAGWRRAEVAVGWAGLLRSLQAQQDLVVFISLEGRWGLSELLLGKRPPDGFQQPDAELGVQGSGSAGRSSHH